METCHLRNSTSLTKHTCRHWQTFLHWHFIQVKPICTQNLKGQPLVLWHKPHRNYSLQEINPHHVEFVLWTAWAAKIKSDHSIAPHKVAAAKESDPDHAKSSAESSPRKVTFLGRAQFPKDAHTGSECSWGGTYICFGGASDGRSKWLPLPGGRE